MRLLGVVLFLWCYVHEAASNSAAADLSNWLKNGKIRPLPAAAATTSAPAAAVAQQGAPQLDTFDWYSLRLMLYVGVSGVLFAAASVMLCRAARRERVVRSVRAQQKRD